MTSSLPPKSRRFLRWLLPAATAVLVLVVALVVSLLPDAPAGAPQGQPAPLEPGLVATNTQRPVSAATSSAPTQATAEPAAEPATDPVTSSVLPPSAFLKEQQLVVVNGDEGFRATFPATGDLQEKAKLLTGYEAHSYQSVVLRDPATGRICPRWQPNAEPCQGLNEEVYHLWMEPMAELPPAEAGFDPGVYTDVRRTTFAGWPANAATFHTPDGGSGPYVDVWKDGWLYHIWAHGGKSPAAFADQFLASFKFTA